MNTLCETEALARKPTLILTKIETHKTNPCNDLLEIAIASDPGPGGAPFSYLVYWPEGRGRITNMTIPFQNGPIPQHGVNGLTSEALLAILIHRHESFQSGPFPSPHNAEAIEYMKGALKAFKKRTLERQARGVEGKLEK